VILRSDVYAQVDGAKERPTRRPQRNPAPTTSGGYGVSGLVAVAGVCLSREKEARTDMKGDAHREAPTSRITRPGSPPARPELLPPGLNKVTLMPFTAYDAAIDAVERARALLAGARPTGRPAMRRARGVRPSTLPAATRQDMRRLSIVMAVAALDTYMHRLILERVYTHEDLPGALARLGMAFQDLLNQADATGHAARQPPDNPRPRVGVKRVLRDRLLRETFQSYDDVGRASPWQDSPEAGRRLRLSRGS
jgi:hypothetical protein